MRGVRVFLLISSMLFVGLPVYSQGQFDDRKVAHAKYDELAAKVNSGDLSIDWRNFRLAAALSQLSLGFDWQSVHSQFVNDLDAGRYEKALAEAQTVIDNNMAFGEGHLLAMTALRKMGKEEEAKKQEAILNAIGRSIMQSGDGSSAATAWFTVGPSESLFFLTAALGAKLEGQELVHLNGHAYDKLTVRDRQGNTRFVWFNTDTNEELKERALHPKVAQQ
jgi:hypothetical protein